MVPLLLDQRPAGFERRRHDGGEVHPFLPELDLAPRDAGDVQQVIQQPRQMRDLPIEDLSGRLDVGRARRTVADELRSNPDRSERVPELVREHREKLILRRVPLGQTGHRLGGLLGADARPQERVGERREQVRVDAESCLTQWRFVSNGGPQGVHRQIVASGKAPDGRFLRKRREAVAGDHGPDDHIASPEGAPDEGHTVVVQDDSRVRCREARAGALREQRGLTAVAVDGLEQRSRAHRPEHASG